MVRAHKRLAHIERAFRCLKTVDLESRPVFHWSAPRCAPMLFRLLAYPLECHLRQPWRPSCSTIATAPGAPQLLFRRHPGIPGP